MPKGVYKRKIGALIGIGKGKKNPKGSLAKMGNKNPMFGKRAWNKGKPHLVGKKNPAWKGGRLITKMGYILIYKPNHPYHNYSGSHVFEHRLVMESHIGRILSRKEVVHHINGKKDDNRIENLELMTQAEHVREHYNFTTHRYAKI